MPTKTHSTRNEAGEFNLSINGDGTWPNDAIQVAILADIRRRLTAAAQRETESLGIQRYTLQVLRRIDKRLAKQIKLR